jgi:hypothetical protein
LISQVKYLKARSKKPKKQKNMVCHLKQSKRKKLALWITSIISKPKEPIPIIVGILTAIVLFLFILLTSSY